MRIGIGRGTIVSRRFKRQVCLCPVNRPVFFCPSMKRDEVEALKRQHPDLYLRALAIEENAMPYLKTVKGLGRNYAWKERYGKG